MQHANPNIQTPAADREPLHQNRRIEARLNALQNRNRLGVHMFERCNDMEYPDFSRSGFYDDPAAIKAALTSHPNPKARLLSMSLIPPQQAKFTMRPFGCVPARYPLVGYLVNLDNDSEHPARTARAYERSLYSDDDFTGKKFGLSQMTSQIGVLRECYQNARQPKQIQAIGLDNSHALSAAQLDALGNAYLDDRYRNIFEDDRFTEGFNEILVAAAHPHIEAIVVPSMNRATQPHADMGATLEAFLGALAGLQHLAEGVDLPVVRYQVDGAGRGNITMMAQGREALCDLLALSLSDMQLKPDAVSAYHPVSFSDNTPREWLQQARQESQAVLEKLGVVRDLESFGEFLAERAKKAQNPNRSAHR